MSRFAALAAALAAGPPARPATDFDRTPRGERTAAVLLLFSDAADPELTFVQRAETMRSHAGQIAFPGGAADPADPTPVATALREAQEEVGLSPEEVTVLGALPPLWVPASRYDVTAIIGTWPGGRALLAADPAETGAVHSFAVSRLSSPEVRVTARHPSGFQGPGFAFPGAFVWGLTGHLVDWALELGGWARPWDRARIVDVPRRFLRD